MDSNFAALQEALFIPGKEGVLQTSDELIGVASAYERWMEQQVGVQKLSLYQQTAKMTIFFLTPSQRCLCFRRLRGSASGAQLAGDDVSQRMHLLQESCFCVMQSQAGVLTISELRWCSQRGTARC